jgi:hypothetical protein
VIQVENFRHPDTLPADVQQLFADAEGISVDLGLAWFRNLIENVYPTDNGVRFYVLRRDGKPVAALPILVHDQAGGKQVRGLANYYSALYAPALDVSVEATDLVPLLRSALENEGSIASFHLAPMDPDARTYQTMFDALRMTGLVPFRFFCFGNWYLNVKGDWLQYLAERKGTLRNTIKRMGKKLSSDGGFLEVVESEGDVVRAIKAYEQVYEKSWKIPEPYISFVPELIRMCARKGWLRLGIAWLNGKPLATQIWIVANGKASIYKMAYDEAYKQYAPGTLVTSLLMEHVLCEDGVKEVDYMIGDDKYKQTWMSHRRERWGILAYNPRNLRGLYGLSREFAGRLVKEWSRRFHSRFGKADITDLGATSPPTNAHDKTVN